MKPFSAIRRAKFDVVNYLNAFLERFIAFMEAKIAGNEAKIANNEKNIERLKKER